MRNHKCPADVRELKSTVNSQYATVILIRISTKQDKYTMNLQAIIVPNHGRNSLHAGLGWRNGIVKQSGFDAQSRQPEMTLGIIALKQQKSAGDD